MILAGDIGGTKTLLGLFSAEAGPGQPIDLRSYPTTAVREPSELIREYLAGREIAGAALGVAGAVIDDRATGSNLPWTVDRQSLEAAAGAPTLLLNDLLALAAWVPRLADDDLVTLQAGRPEPEGAIGVVAPGTGLGEAMLFFGPGGYRPAPSEAGHIDFAPNNALEAAWWSWLRERFGHVSLERACSGSSLPMLVEFLTERGDHEPDPDTRTAIDAADDATPAVVAAGLDGRCPVCVQALETFADILAAAAGNLALQIVATGGIYLGGGLSPRLLSLVRTGRWLARFHDKGRFRALMETVPVHVIVDARAGLYGAAACALAAEEGSKPGARV